MLIDYTRNFWRARRNGPLRYIIPYRDDQPPPYSQANVAGTVPAAGGNDTTDSGNTIPVTFTHFFVVLQVLT